MTPHVARVIDSCERASLVFDLATIAATMRAVAAAAHAANIRALFAMKSFPRAEVRALAAEQLDGFDVASRGELHEIGAHAGDRVISIVDPSGLAIADAPRGGRVLVGCETVAQVHAAPAHAELAIRISASITGRDPAIGAVLEGSGRRTSRFGAAERDQVAALVRAAGPRPLGIHVHHGPVTATSVERFIATARFALELFDREPAFINVGGAWHGIADLPAAFAQLRAAFPAIELFVEPGRAYATHAGFACGRVLATRDLVDRRLCVVELSRACHLRWSQPELVAPPPRADARHKVMLVGPTCYEEDVIGEWIVEPAHVAQRVVLRNITGYAVAWNTGFGGIPPADVVLVH